MKKTGLTLACFLLADAAWSCTTCNPNLKQAIFNQQFGNNLTQLLGALAFFLISYLCLLAFLFGLRKRALKSGKTPSTGASKIPVFAAATLLGAGLGGFIDGIVFHQLLQWHATFSLQITGNTALTKSINMFWDGVFHSLTFLTTLAGICLLWWSSGRKQALRSNRLLLGGLLSGWGLFNITEGLWNHLFYETHFVKETTSRPDIWNMGFLFAGLLLCIWGLGLYAKTHSRQGELWKSDIAL
jgi:uncharacterized membrane protein